MDSASCSKDNENERKTYPIRKRIQTDKAVASIINWVDKDVDTLSDSDIESSEEDDWTSDDGESANEEEAHEADNNNCLLYTSPSPRDKRQSRMPSSA